MEPSPVVPVQYSPPRHTVKRKTSDEERSFFGEDEAAASVSALHKVARLNTPDTSVSVAGRKRIMKGRNGVNQNRGKSQFRDKVRLTTNTTEFLKITHRIDPQPQHRTGGVGRQRTNNFNRQSPSHKRHDSLDTLDKVRLSANERMSMGTSQSSDRVRIRKSSPTTQNGYGRSGQQNGPYSGHRLSVRRRPNMKSQFTFDLESPRSDSGNSVQTTNTSSTMMVGGTQIPRIRRGSLSEANSATPRPQFTPRGQTQTHNVFNFDVPSPRGHSNASSRSTSRGSLSSTNSSPRRLHNGGTATVSNGVMPPPSVPRFPSSRGSTFNPHQNVTSTANSFDTSEEWRRIVSAPTIVKPMLTSLGSSGQQQATSTSTTTSPNHASPWPTQAANDNRGRVSRFHMAAATALRVGISNRINHQTIPSLNKPLTGPRQSAAAPVKLSKRKPRNLFLDCAAIEQESGIAPPLSCRPDLNAASTNVCSKIADGLFVGGAPIARNAAELSRWGITHIINCVAMQCPCAFPNQFEYMSFNMRDSGTEDIAKYVYSVLGFICDAHRNGGNVLIHCMRGISRSGSLAIAYMIWKQGMTLEVALRYCKAQRPAINPNAAFMFQLSDWALHRPSLLPHTATHVYQVDPASKMFNAATDGGHAKTVNILTLPDNRRVATQDFDDAVNVDFGHITGGFQDNDANSAVSPNNAVSGALNQAPTTTGLNGALGAGLDASNPRQLVPLLVGPLIHFSASMFNANTDKCYIVVADGVLFVWRPSSTFGRPRPPSAQGVVSPSTTDLNGSTNSANPRPRQLVLEAAVDLLQRFEKCGDRTVQWVDDGAEPPEFWSSFAQIPKVPIVVTFAWPSFLYFFLTFSVFAYCHSVKALG